MTAYGAEAGVTPRIYRGLNRRERAGWIAGLTVAQASACLVLALPVLLAISAGHWRAGLGWAAIGREIGRASCRERV